MNTTALPAAKRKRPHIQLPADFNDEAASLKRGGIELVAGALGIGVSTAHKFKAEGRLLPATPVGDRKISWTYAQIRQMARDGIAPVNGANAA
jgi:hypothetical protein